MSLQSENSSDLCSLVCMLALEGAFIRLLCIGMSYLAKPSLRTSSAETMVAAVSFCVGGEWYCFRRRYWSSGAKGSRVEAAMYWAVCVRDFEKESREWRFICGDLRAVSTLCDTSCQSGSRMTCKHCDAM